MDDTGVTTLNVEVEVEDGAETMGEAMLAGAFSVEDISVGEVSL